MATVEIEGAPFPATVIRMQHEALTFVTLEYHRRTFRFSVRGAELPYEVSYLHEFDAVPGDAATAEQHAAWFEIAPERAAEPEVLQEYLYPQLVAEHDRTLARHSAV